MMKKKTMSSRERVVTALSHREPDRVPISMSITIDAYNNLKKLLGIELEDDKPAVGHWTDVPIHPIVNEKFGLDVFWLRMGSPKKKHFAQPNDPNKRMDEWGIEWTKVALPNGGYYYEMSSHPLQNATIEDLEDYPWPDPYDPGRVEGLAQYLKHIHDDTEFAILAKFGGALFETAWYMRGMEQFFTDLVDNPDFVHALFKKLLEIQKGMDKVGIEAAGEYVDILRLSGEDMGSQEKGLISLPMFRRLVRPYLEDLWGFAKLKLLEKNPNAKIMLHSCGAVRSFIPDWIDMGLDILDPVQPNAKGMDPFELKRDFGDRLSFHGGIDAQYVLPFGTPDEVCHHTRKYIQALGPGGGFILAPVHNVQGDVSPENLVAMRDAVEEFGYYPIGA
jgi:uroporphyrinogen decarboxylase